MWVGEDRVVAMVCKQHERGVGCRAREKIQLGEFGERRKSTGQCDANSGKALGLSSIE